jgi:hypothetical protein
MVHTPESVMWRRRKRAPRNQNRRFQPLITKDKPKSQFMSRAPLECLGLLVWSLSSARLHFLLYFVLS